MFYRVGEGVKTRRLVYIFIKTTFFIDLYTISVIVTIATTTVITTIALQLVVKRQYRLEGKTTTLIDRYRGVREVQKVLYNLLADYYNITGLKRSILKSLCLELRKHSLSKGRIVSLKEKVIIYLDFLRYTKGIRQLYNNYQHSYQTFQRVIKEVSKAVYTLLSDYISEPRRHNAIYSKL